MSLNKSVESTLLLTKDTPCDSISDENSSTVKAHESNLNSCSHENVSERLRMEELDSTSGIINGKKPLCYEKMNGFTHNVKHHETTVNGEAFEALSVCGGDDNDTKNVPKALTSVEVNSDDVCNFPTGHDRIKSTQLTDKGTAQCLESVRGHSEEGHSVEELIVKLASTPMSLTEDSEQTTLPSSDDLINGITYVIYESERQMPDIMRLITKDLSEPYSIYTYRYFIHNWPKLCFLAMDNHNCVGAIVCKLDVHKKMVRRGYIAMLAVDSEYRRMRIGSTLVTKAIHAMIRDDCDEVVLETEITNQAALHLYENLGFVRDKRLFRYYLNGVDALRLKLWLR